MLDVGRGLRPLFVLLHLFAFCPRLALLLRSPRPALPLKTVDTPRLNSLLNTCSSMSAPESCDICQCGVPKGGWDSHIRGRAHCRRAALRREAVLQSAHRDRDGVAVSSQDAGLDFGVVDPGRVAQVSKSFTLKVTTETAEFMVLEPQWTSSSLSVGAATACVIPCLLQPPPDELFHPAAFRADSRVIPTLGKVATFESS